jgi:hypothetical protein
MKIFPTIKQIDKTIAAFDKADPLYKLPAEYGDPNYYVYMIEDAACETLLDEAKQSNEPFFTLEAQVLSEAASKELKNYSLILKMRFVLQEKLNQTVNILPVDQQG